jgi:hypothetical protein
MLYKNRWAYDFECTLTLEAIYAILNDAGPWQWQMRDSYIFGSYLNTRPSSGVHLRVHEYPQAFITGPREKGFRALLELEADSSFEMIDIDAVFRGLLDQIGAADIKNIEPYD